MLHRVQLTDLSTSTVQSRLCESGLHGWIAAKKPLLKATNKKKRLARAKKHEQWTLDWRKFVLWSGVHILDFWFDVGEWMIFTRVFSTVKHGEGGVMVWGCFVGDTVGDLFRIQGTFNQHGHPSILQRYALPSGLCLVGLPFVFQQENDPTHLQAV